MSEGETPRPEGDPKSRASNSREIEAKWGALVRPTEKATEELDLSTISGVAHAAGQSRSAVAEAVQAAARDDVTSSIARAVKIAGQQQEELTKAIQAQEKLRASIAMEAENAQRGRSAIAEAVQAAAQRDITSSLDRAVRIARQHDEATSLTRMAREIEMGHQAQGLQNSIAFQLREDPWNSDAFRLAQAFRNSDAFRVAEGFRYSDAFRLAHDCLNSETFRLLREYQTSSMIDALGGGRESPLAHVVGSLQESPALAFIERTGRWATQVSAAGLLSTGAVAAEVDRIQRVAAGILSLDSGLGRLEPKVIDLTSGTEITRLKLAALASSSDVLGFGASTTATAYQNLFGQWHTNPDLPERFWLDAEVRRHRYFEAEVDPGLIESTPAAAIEVAIDSGFAAGVTGEGVSVAIFDIAGISLQVRSSNTRLDAFQLIDTFERALREFIAHKLSQLAGPRWFKQRVPGDLVVKARSNRAAALANGERETEHIAYLDLGDLMSVILQRNNWGEAFEQIFPNRDRLVQDLQALVAGRRPTMHAREIDAVRLVEMLCIVRRLTQSIEDDGEWKRISEAED
ncbi:hypothetical protein H8A99_15340 [Bradyrhizobium sp. Arg68]|uniref:Swt1 family HEPN domain-containing protein n=1 Tax=Bradyrhizobium ivorense TaxID=2511166 RepID=UPI001E40949B|nr:Swt1 family HEPN domain-containing protein [Bradyrhizobium ivorense]MCC8937808.1 hypothetical protein [Bradyrhizobium ivorense]